MDVKVKDDQVSVMISDSIVYYPPTDNSKEGRMRLSIPVLPTSYGTNPHPEGSSKHGFFELYRPENEGNENLLKKVMQDAMIESGMYEKYVNPKEPGRFYCKRIVKKK